MEFIMPNQVRWLIALALGLFFIVTVSTVFYNGLAALGYVYSLAITTASMLLLLVAAWLMQPVLKQLGLIRYWLAAPVFIMGYLWLAHTPMTQQSATTVRMSYFNTDRSVMVNPSPFSAWGRTIKGYEMHPGYGDAEVPYSLTADFAKAPETISLRFAKPPAALYGVNGEPTDSDGISVEVKLFDRQGALQGTTRWLLSQRAFLDDKWVTENVRSEAGIARMELTLGWGPPGGTPDFDSTLVAFGFITPINHLQYIGQLLLLCLAAYTLLLCLALNAQIMMRREATPALSATSRRVPWLCAAGVTALLVGLAYWSQSQTQFAFYWDFRNYWQKTEVLYELIQSSSWHAAIELFADGYATDYSSLPAVLPALAGFLFGYPTRMMYSLIITVLYAAPAYILVAYLAKRILDADDAAPAASNHLWILAALPVILGMPRFFGTTLLLMPDIGGVILFSAALLNAASLTKALTAAPALTPSWRMPIRTMVQALNLGVIFCVMFIFRRWYVFAAVGIVFAALVVTLASCVHLKVNYKVLLIRAGAAGVIMAAAALPLFCWVLFEWSNDLGDHNYALLYASYQYPLTYDLTYTMVSFGVLVFVLCAASLVLLARRVVNHRLLLLLVISSVTAVVLFLHIQSPARHHFYLIMPLLGTLMAALALMIQRRYGLLGSLLLSLMLLAGGTVTTMTQSNPNEITLFATYKVWLPKQQKYMNGLQEISQWLQTTAVKNKTFCLIASSESLNQGVFNELWQIEPSVGKHDFDRRLIPLGQVDSVNGPPSKVVRDCEIFLVGTPFQSHLQKGQQHTLEIIQQDMLTGSGIGAAANRNPRIFEMGEGIQFRAYQLDRTITEDEYQSLVARYLKTKAEGLRQSPVAAP